jgi:uroporphyrinogen-III synthase
LDARSLGAFQVAAVGRATAAALGRMGVLPDLVALPGEVSAGRRLGESLVAARAAVVTGFMADKPRRELGEELGTAGVQFAQIPCYGTRPAEVSSALLASLVREGVDAVLLSSPSAARVYSDLFGKVQWPLVALGPTTAAAIRELGGEVAVVCRSPSVPDQIDAVERAVSGAASSPDDP